MNTRQTWYPSDFNTALSLTPALPLRTVCRRGPCPYAWDQNTAHDLDFSELRDVTDVELDHLQLGTPDDTVRCDCNSDFVFDTPSIAGQLPESAAQDVAQLVALLVKTTSQRTRFRDVQHARIMATV